MTPAGQSERATQKCRAHGIEPPLYDAGMAGLMLTFRANPEHVQAALEQGSQTPVATMVTPVEMPVKTQERLIELLRANPQMTLAELAEETGRSRRAVERAAAKLVSDGRLRFVGARKSGHWETLE